MSKFCKISLAVALAIFVASPVFALDEVFDPLADLYLELEEKADPDPEVVAEDETTADDYLTELEKMAARMEAAGNGETTTDEPDATESETAEPAEENAIDSPTEVQISQSGGAIEDAVNDPDENLTTTPTIENTNPPLVASADVGSEVFVFAYDGSAVTHSAASELTAAGPAAIALFALAGGLAGAYFWRRKFLNV